MNITIPTSLQDITVEQYQKYNRVINLTTTEEAKVIGIVAVFCNLTTEQILQMEIADVKQIAEDIANVLSQEPKFIQRFGNYGFEPNLNEIKTSVYIDAEKYILDIDNAHRAMAVLYREIDKSVLGTYSIKPYEGSDKLCNEMLQAPLEVYLGMRLFFWNLSKDLLKATMEYLAQQNQETEQLEQTLEKNGGGISQLIQSLMGAESLLMKPLI